jgi:hypothetical protein
VELDIQNLQEDNAKDSVSDSSSDSERDEDDESEQEAVPMDAQVAECIKTIQDAIELLQEQAAKGSEKWFISSNKANYTLLEEVNEIRNKRR